MKFIVYKTLVLPVLIHGSEIWPLTVEIENKYNNFYRKILYRIIGQIQENDQWRKRYNNELYKIHGEPAVMNIIKASRLRWSDTL